MSELQVFNFRCSDHGEGTEMVACEECWDLMRSAGVKAEARAQAAEARVVELEGLLEWAIIEMDKVASNAYVVETLSAALNTTD